MSRRDRGWSDDPLVPVSGEHVAAVIRESGLGITEVARALGVNQPTLTYVINGKTKRCHKSLLDALAARFGVLPGWLSGDPDFAPFEERLQATAMAQGTEFSPEELRQGLPPLVELKATKLIQECLDRWEDDLESGTAPSPPGVLGELRETRTRDQWRAWTGTYLYGLLLNARTFKPHIYQFPAKLTADDAEFVHWWMSEDDGFAAAWIDALSRLLRPWLDGQRALDYAACYRFLAHVYERSRGLIRGAEHEAFAKVRKTRS